MEKIPVYFMPGLAASPLIFENIKLPKDKFEVIFLEWTIPLQNESLQEYAKRTALEIKHKNPVLVGVSFGGVLVQEISKFIEVKKVIIISSIKSNLEFPKRMRFAKSTNAYRLIPTRLMSSIEFTKFSFGSKKLKHKLDLYKKYLAVRDKTYLDWAFKQIVLWDRAEPDQNVIHIHGDADEVFPSKYLKNYISIKGGTHIMIINKFRWINEHLPKIILEEET